MLRATGRSILTVDLRTPRLDKIDEVAAGGDPAYTGDVGNGFRRETLVRLSQRSLNHLQSLRAAIRSGMCT
jgi:hypothetical protein